MSDINSSGIQSFNNPPELQNTISGKSMKKPGGKKRIILISLLVVFVITGIAGLGFARGFYDNHRGGGHGPLSFMMGKILDDLDLSSKQKGEIDKIKDEIKAKMDAKKNDRKSDMEGMMQMFRSDTFDKQKALEISKKHDADRDEMRSFMIDEMAKFHDILSSEQRNKAVDKMKEFHDKKNEMRGKWNKDKDK